MYLNREGGTCLSTNPIIDEDQHHMGGVVHFWEKLVKWPKSQNLGSPSSPPPFGSSRSYFGYILLLWDDVPFINSGLTATLTSHTHKKKGEKREGMRRSWPNPSCPVHVTCLFSSNWGSSTPTGRVPVILWECHVQNMSFAERHAIAC